MRAGVYLAVLVSCRHVGGREVQFDSLARGGRRFVPAEKKRLLMVLPRVPYPAQDGTTYRILDMVTALAAEYRLSFFVMVDTVPSSESIQGLQQHGDVECLLVSPFARPGMAGKLRRLVYRVRRRLQAPQPEWGIYCPRALVHGVARAAARLRPAAVIVSTLPLAFSVKMVPRHILRVVDPMDVWHERCREFSRIGIPDLLSQYSTPAQEARVLRHFDVVVAITGSDARLLSDMVPKARIVVCGVSHRIVPCGDAPTQGMATVMFAGGRGHFNEDGVRFFVNAMWPQIRAHVPDAQFVVLSAAEGLASSIGVVPGVRLLGRAEDLAGWYGQAQVVAVPLRYGTGLKIKVVEALAHGAATVMTSVAARGLPEAMPAPFLVRDRPEAFAAAVVNLLQDVSARHDLKVRAHMFARRTFAREAVYAELRRFLP